MEAKAKEIFAVLWALELSFSGKAVFDKQTGMYYCLEKENEETYMVSPIGSTDSQMLPKQNAIVLTDSGNPLKIAELNRIQPTFNPFFTPTEPTFNLHSSYIQPTNNVHQTDNQQVNELQETARPKADEPDFIGKRGHLYPKIAHTAPAHVQKISSEIERLIHKKIKNTNQSRTLKTARTDYSQFVNILEGQTPEMVNDLERLKTKILKNLKQQRVGTEVEQQTSARKKTYRKLKEFFGTVVVLVVIVSVGWKGLGFDTPTLFDDKFNEAEYMQQIDAEYAAADIARSKMNNSSKTVNRKKFSQNEIDEIITEYADNHKKKIWGWRRGQIQKAAKGKKLTKWELTKIIENNLDKY